MPFVHRGIARLAIAIVLVIPGSASSQDVTEPALKAAYIYNFALFTEWPADLVPASAPFVMCVLGDAAVGEALEQVVKGRVLAGHKMAVSRVARPETQGACHILYMSGVTVGQMTQLVAGLHDLPVLTISDLEGFTEAGGMAQLFFENGRLRFSVQLRSAEKARLRISSRLLTLATRK